MKQFFICFSLAFIIIACSNKPKVEGRWAVEINEDQDTAILVNIDTILALEIQIDKDSIYLDTKKNGVISKTVFLGGYIIDNDEIVITNQYGEQKRQRLILKEDTLIIADRNNSQKIIMRLTRIKESY